MPSPRSSAGTSPFSTNPQFLAEALAQVDDAIIIVDAELRVTYLNAKAAKQYSIDATAALGRHLTELYHYVWLGPDDEQTAMRALARDGHWRGENLHMLPSGKALHVESTVTQLQGQAGDPYMMAVIRDISAQKEQMHRLQRAGWRATLAETAAHGFIYEWNMLTGEVERSQGTYPMLGYQPEELEGDLDTWRKLIHPDDYPQVGVSLLRMLQTQSHFSIEYRLRHREGRYLHVWDQGIVERDSSGTAIRVVGITADISERKRMEQALHETQERFRLALDKAPMTFAHMDRELRYTWIHNPHPDYRDDLFIGKRDDALGTAPSIERLMKTKRQVLENGTGTRGEFTFLLSDGEHTYDITFEPLRDPNGEFVGLTTAALDITERKAVEKQVRRSEERLRRMMEGAQVGIAFGRSDGTILECNDAFLELLGYTRTEFATAGLNWRDIGRPQVEESTDCLVQRLTQTGHIRPVERVLQRKDGGSVTTMMSGATVDIAGDPAHDEHVAFVVDLSELKQAQAQLQELNDTLERRVAERTVELERSNRELDRFAYIASHDLKAPLRAIDNLAGWIVEDSAAALSPTSMAYLIKLRSRVKRLESLLEDLLLYSRAGRDRHGYEIVDTTALVHNIVDLLNPPLGMQVSIQGELPAIRCERAPLETVLRNLIENAVKHHHQPGEGTIVITACQHDGMVEYAVGDNGPGIDPQFHERIFEVFQTLRPRDEVEGSGMGLAIVKKTVESAGGKIHVESTLGHGATFCFTWPLTT